MSSQKTKAPKMEQSHGDFCFRQGCRNKRDDIPLNDATAKLSPKRRAIKSTKSKAEQPPACVMMANIAED
jgi:hypothetical protein